MKSYPIVYQGDIATALNNIGITDFMILNDLLAVAYVADDFNGDILDNTYEVAWYQESKTMSTMIEINENIEGGERVATVSRRRIARMYVTKDAPGAASVNTAP